MEIYDPDSFEVQLHVLDHTKEVPEVVHRTTYSKNRAFLGYADMEYWMLKETFGFGIVS